MKKLKELSFVELKALFDFSLFQLNEQTMKGNDKGMDYWSNIYHKCRRELLIRVEDFTTTEQALNSKEVGK